MRVLTADAVERLGGRRWVAAARALRAASALAPERAHSIGDAVTYVVFDRRFPWSDAFVGHRRYVALVGVLAGSGDIEVAAKAALTPEASYSDLTDRETFTGAGRARRLVAGEVALVDPAEAYRIAEPGEGRFVLVLVTVEGEGFHP